MTVALLKCIVCDFAKNIRFNGFYGHAGKNCYLLHSLPSS